MSTTLDPELAAVLRSAGAAATFPAEIVGDAAAAARYLAAARRATARETAEVEPVGAVVDLVVASGPPVRVYVPGGDVPHDGWPVVVFFHGGGWVLGNLAMQDETCRRLAGRAEVAVVSVDYRLAPEQPFPAAFDDAVAAVAWAAAGAVGLSVSIDGARLAVVGMSAGGNLAAAVALWARECGGFALALQVLLYPALDARADTASFAENAAAPILNAEQMRWYWRQYLAADGDAGNPFASPSAATDLAGLPTALIVAAALDPLRDEALEYGARLAAAGVPTTISLYAGQTHSFMRFFGLVGAADRALDEIVGALRGALQPQPSERGASGR